MCAHACPMCRGTPTLSHTPLAPCLPLWCWRAVLEVREREESPDSTAGESLCGSHHPHSVSTATADCTGGWVPANLAAEGLEPKRAHGHRSFLVRRGHTLRHHPAGGFAPYSLMRAPPVSMPRWSQMSPHRTSQLPPSLDPAR